MPEDTGSTDETRSVRTFAIAKEEMGRVAEAKRKLPNIGDVAVALVKERGAPIPARELLEAVLERLPLTEEERSQRMAEIFSQISFDHRLVPLDRSFGLREWAPKPKFPRGTARVAAIAPRKLRREVVEEEEEELEEPVEELEEVEEIEPILEEPEGDWD